MLEAAVNAARVKVLNIYLAARVKRRHLTPIQHGTKEEEQLPYATSNVSSDPIAASGQWPLNIVACALPPRVLLLLLLRQGQARGLGPRPPHRRQGKARGQGPRPPHRGARQGVDDYPS